VFVAVALALAVALAATGLPAAAQQSPPPEEPQIVGGTPTDPGEYPFTVALLFEDADGGVSDPLLSQYCAGTLLTSTLVLTAGHCADFGEAPEDIPVSVLVGQEDLDATPLTGEIIPVIGEQVHHRLYFSDQYLDLAILELASPASAPPVAIAGAGDAALFTPGTDATIVGWGSYDDGTRYPSEQLEGTVDIIDDEVCVDAYRVARVDIPVDTLVCAGLLGVGGVDSCYGDSGGPLLVDDGDAGLLQVGVVDGGIGCGLPDFPGAYMELPVFEDWLAAFQDPPFPDLPVSDPAFQSIAWLASSGITTGFVDGTFRPAAPVSRAAMAAYLYRLSGEPAFTPPSPRTFRDVRLSHPFFHEVEWVAAEEVANGFSDGTFRPGRSITRSAMAAYLYRLAGEPSLQGYIDDFGEEIPDDFSFFEDVQPSDTFFIPIMWLAVTGIADSWWTGRDNGLFRPSRPVTRGVLATWLDHFDALGFTPAP
jgi:hypothetical protein